MTTLAALLLTVVVVAAVAYPLVQRPSGVSQRRRVDDVAELEERYKSALADLQDVEADWEIGNLSPADYRALRDEHRLRAAETLREIVLQQAHRTRVRAELGAISRFGGQGSGVGGQGPPPSNEIVPTNGLVSLTPDLPPLAPAPRSPTPEPAPRASAPAPEGAPGPRVLAPGRAAVMVGAAVAAFAVLGIGVLYVRSVAVQAAQAPLATLPISHAHTVVAGEKGDWVGHHDGLLFSTDGRTWSETGARGDVMAVVGGEGNSLLAFGHDVALESADGVSAWTALQHDLPGTDVHGAGRGALGFYAYVEGFGLFRSPDAHRWTQIGNPVAQSVSGLAVLPGSGGSDILFLAAGGTVVRSPDGGRTWGAAAGAANAALTGAVRSIAAQGGAAADALYAATTDGLFRSTSRGADWIKLPFRGSAAAVGVYGLSLAVVDDRGQFFVSHDDGGTWTAQ